MLTHGDATATGVLLKGVEPSSSLGVGLPEGSPCVLDLPKQIQKGSFEGLRIPGAKPPERKSSPLLPPVPRLDDRLDGGSSRDGGTFGLLQAIEDDLRRKEEATRDAKKDAGNKDDKDDKKDDEPSIDAIAALEATPADKLHKDDKNEPRVTDVVDELDGGVPEDGEDAGPEGDVEPDGGYASVLPDEDTVPADVDPDVCADPALVAKLPGIVIGTALSKTLKLDLGDCVTVTSPTIGYSYSGGSIKPPVAKRFRVIALFEAGFDQYDSKLVYTDLYEAQAFYDQGDTVTGVEMVVEDIDDAKQIARQISVQLASGLYHTMDWEELNHGLFTALLIQQILMSGVLALIIVVAAFTVVATLIMVVLDKTKEISVLKAMGATDGQILRIFLYQGGIIGVLGTSFGLLLGLAVCKGLLVYGFPLDPKVYFISRLPVQVRPLEFLITGAIAIVICLVATIIPSAYAARLRPAEGFRAQ
jgi:lipoprotein-releasing system permease protein